MFRRAAIALLAVAIGGCRGDTATDVLPAGGTALMDDAGGGIAAIYVPREEEAGHDALQALPLPPGTPVVVIDDATGAGNRSRARSVLVRVAGGERKGVVGYVARYKLRATSGE